MWQSGSTAVGRVIVRPAGRALAQKSFAGLRCGAIEHVLVLLGVASSGYFSEGVYTTSNEHFWGEGFLRNLPIVSFVGTHPIFSHLHGDQRFLWSLCAVSRDTPEC